MRIQVFFRKEKDNNRKVGENKPKFKYKSLKLNCYKTDLVDNHKTN